jgi:hypothetical protein
VKVTVRVWLPAVRTVPFTGLYVNFPAIVTPLDVAVASSWLPPNAVPYVIAAGTGHAITGTDFVAAIDSVAVVAR